MHNLSVLIRKLFKLIRKLKLKKEKKPIRKWFNKKRTLVIQSKTRKKVISIKGNYYSLDDSHKYMIMPKCIEDLSSNYKEVELTLSTYKLYISTNSLIQ